MAFAIMDTCVGCTMCLTRCPTDAITGATKEQHFIDPNKCIDCGVCATYCPVECIIDNNRHVVHKIKPKDRPIAIVDQIECTGCEFCIDACPFDCFDLVPADDGNMPPVAVMARPKQCVACRLCEEVCIKQCVTVRWPDGTICEEFPKAVEITEVDGFVPTPTVAIVPIPNAPTQYFQGANFGPLGDPASSDKRDPEPAVAGTTA